MTRILRQTLGLLAGTMLLMLGIGTLGTLVPVRLADADVSTTAIGAVSAGYFLGLIVGAYAGHRTIVAVGHIRAFVTFTSVLSAATLIHPFAVDAAPWLVLRLIQGACMSGLSMCIESWLNQVATDRVRGRLLSVYMMVLYLSQGVGQSVLTIPDASGFGLFVIASVMVSLAAVPVAAARLVAPRRPRRRPIAVLALVRASPSAVAAALASGLMLGAFYGLAPVFARGIGMDLSATAAFMAAAIIGGVLLQYPLGWASDRLERRTVIAAASAALALVCAGVAAVSQWAPAMVLWLAPVFGGLLFTIYPLSVAQANDRISPDERMPVAGSLLISYGVGATLGPILASLTIDGTGPEGLFLYIGGIAVVAGVVALVRKGVRAAVASEDKVLYLAVPRTTVVADTLDPRTDEPVAETPPAPASPASTSAP